VIQRAHAHHLEILRAVRRWRIGVGLVECIRHAHPFDWPLADAVNHRWGGDSGDFQDRRNDVNDVVELVTDAARVHKIPANNMTFAQAACFPVALQTMHNAVVTAGRLKRGEALLIQGASTGVGLMGMQIGKVMGARLVIGTSTNPARRGYST